MSRPGWTSWSARSASSNSAARPASAGVAPQVSSLRVVDELRRTPGPASKRGPLAGAVAYAGTVRRASAKARGSEYGVRDLAELPSEGLVRVLSAVAHRRPARAPDALLASPRTSQELQQVLGTTLAGPLYHHLDDLIASGLVQRREHRYQVPIERAVPVLASIAAAGDLAGGSR